MTSSASRSNSFVASIAVAALALAGCASPGVPRPPSLRLPEPVAHLSAERHGADVVVQFQTPVKTTDGNPLTRPVTASLCRAVADGPCMTTASVPARKPIAGSVEWVDVLPPGLAAGRAQRLAYRVEVFNSAGRSAGPSGPALALAGEAPPAVEGFRAEGSHTGVVLHWTPDPRPSAEVLVERESVAPPVAPPKPKPASVAGVATHKKPANSGGPKSPFAGAPKDDRIAWLHAPSGTAGADSGGIVDATAQSGEPYRYTAVRSRFVTVDGQKLEIRSDLSVPVLFTLRDVYPPAVPQALLVAAFPVPETNNIAVDLVWQPNMETDLAGYNVYRQALTSAGSTTGAAVKLNAKPVPLPAFHDVTAARTVSYRYTVTAVDAKNNESPASVAADLAANP